MAMREESMPVREEDSFSIRCLSIQNAEGVWKEDLRELSDCSRDLI